MQFLQRYLASKSYLINYECITFELKIGEKLCTLSGFSRSLSQTQDKFNNFTYYLELSLDLTFQNDPYLVAVFCGFNAMSTNWYGCDKTNFEENVLETLFLNLGYIK